MIAFQTIVCRYLSYFDGGIHFFPLTYIKREGNCSPNIYKEGGKLSVHYATFPALLPYSCRVHKEQNDQIQESDAGASVRVSGQNRPCWCFSKQELFLEFNVCVFQKQEPKALVKLNKRLCLLLS